MRFVRGLIILAIGVGVGFAAGSAVKTADRVIGGVRDITASLRAITPSRVAEPPPPPVVDDPNARWRHVQTVAGRASTSSDGFVLRGGPVRLSYSITGPGLITAWVLPEGTTINDATSLPELIAVREGKDTVRFRKPGGRYYVHVVGGGADWRLIVEEYR